MTNHKTLGTIFFVVAIITSTTLLRYRILGTTLDNDIRIALGVVTIIAVIISSLASYLDYKRKKK